MYRKYILEWNFSPPPTTVVPRPSPRGQSSVELKYNNFGSSAYPKTDRFKRIALLHGGMYKLQHRCYRYYIGESQCVIQQNLAKTYAQYSFALNIMVTTIRCRQYVFETHHVLLYQIDFTLKKYPHEKYIYYYNTMSVSTI